LPVASGDLADDVTREDADLVLTLMSEVLDDVYQSPARVAQAQAARESKKQQQALMEAIRDGRITPGQLPGIQFPQISRSAAAIASFVDPDHDTDPRPGADTAT
jgi:hypothetical protein